MVGHRINHTIERLLEGPLETKTSERLVVNDSLIRLMIETLTRERLVVKDIQIQILIIELETMIEICLIKILMTEE